jgi:conjugal transfer pilus assembly protein TraF
MSGMMLLWLGMNIMPAIAADTPPDTLPSTASASSADSSTAPASPGNWWQDTPWHDSDRGFNWYPPDHPKKAAHATPPRPKIQDMKSMADIKKELDRLKDLAVLQPTPANVHNFLVAQNFVMNKSSTFADVARRVVWQNPDVDYNTRSPTANYALLTKKDMRQAQQHQALSELSRDYGLMFFFRSDCPYCHQQAPVLKLLQNQYGLPVLAVSMDGGGMPGFPDARPDNGISMQASGGRGVDTVPALYLVNRETHESIPIGSGILAMDEIVERIRVLTQTKPGQEF